METLANLALFASAFSKVELDKQRNLNSILSAQKHSRTQFQLSDEWMRNSRQLFCGALMVSQSTAHTISSHTLRMKMEEEEEEEEKKIS